MLYLQYKKSIKKIVLLSLVGSCAPVIAMAQAAAAAPAGPSIDKYQMMRYTLTGIALLFLLIILVMANAVGSAGKIYWEREQAKKSGNKTPPVLLLIFMFSVIGVGAHAQDAVAANAPSGNTGLPYDMYLFLAVVALELAIILVLSRMLEKFLKVRTETAVPKRILSFSIKDLFQKMNQTVALEEEAQLDLNHDYDGIRELDNKVPKWWQYAFYASIVFGIIYCYRMFVAGSLPDQLQELRMANAVAAEQKAAYLLTAANNVDENTVTMMDATGIGEGATLFSKNCIACHGDKGQGGVGPNLTDDYWLHEGSINAIFHSIKYGWPEKGMKSWKDDFSPMQIAQLASYIRSLHGSNPAGAKEPQGTVFAETTKAEKNDTSKTNL